MTHMSNFSLADTLRAQLEASRNQLKLAAAEEEAPKKDARAEKKEETKEEKKDDKKEKVSEARMLAAGLMGLAEKLASGEAALGGKTIAVVAPVKGRQNYDTGSARAKVDTSGARETPVDASGAATAMKTSPSPNLPAYPDRDPLKTASARTVLKKLAEAPLGGWTGTSPSGQGITPPSDSNGGNDVRRFLENNEAPVRMTQKDTIAPQKRMLAKVVKEPALNQATDPVLKNNLAHAGAAGTKLASMSALVESVAADPNHPRHAAVMAKVAEIRARRSAN